MTQGATNPIRDRRVEDPSNTWLIDPIARALLPVVVRLGVPANAVSFTGLMAGAAAAVAVQRWQQPSWALVGLAFLIAWLVADSLDGMVARETGTSSAFGRELDGLCDHGVFAMLYVALAWSVGGGTIWVLVVLAAVAHAVQANLYEAERNRFHRRIGEGAAKPGIGASRNPLVRFYDVVTLRLDKSSEPFDRRLALASRPDLLIEAYRRAAVPTFRMMLPLSPNMRVLAIMLACCLGRVTAFLWYEIVPLSLLAATGMLLHREAEGRTLRAVRA